MNLQKSPPSIGGEISGSGHRLSTCIDWLQVDFRGTSQNGINLTIKDTYKSTLVFHKLFEIWQNNYYIASLVNKPIADFLPKDMNLIKLLNKELYYFKPCARLNEIGEKIGLIALQPSRIDLAIDFNSFAYGYLPQTLISDFFQDKYLKIGIRKWVIDGEQKIIPQSKDSIQYNSNITHYLKFSKPDCNVDTYLYNKSKEMLEVKKKPWIIEQWKRAGLNINKDIWRLEFSLHNPRFIVRDNLTGITERFNWLRLDDKKYLNNVLNILINKYFDFRKNTYIKDIRAMPKVKLFSNIKDTSITWDRSDSIEGKKGDKLFLKKLNQLNDEVRNIYTDIENSAETVINYFKVTRDI